MILALFRGNKNTLKERKVGIQKYIFKIFKHLLRLLANKLLGYQDHQDISVYLYPKSCNMTKVNSGRLPSDNLTMNG